ncbi:DUF6064 family protein [Maridesulfovibrio salexigens]|uniref:Uncharacterized protein n=1 Tax=Maridesulfovibrio salexigens (strain ATCC 14822 / DSM 2638 / NCIMB 8403 / VKM B-1763) TaxID=526222 RepID=C6BUC5_MARSD|nr:DUF6064 family protein [Maridesulfovibrio salexigens]ACS79934.1 hypothetical protein Desal_1873 [Maridesulfovibrio salexigens DSM 2638]
MTQTQIFWNVLKDFRDDTMIVQIALVIGMAIVTWMVFTRPGKATDTFTKFFLALAFLWNSVACFFIACGKSPMAKFLAGPLYAAIGFLFIIDLLVTKNTHFEISRSTGVKLTTAFFILMAFLFPVLGYFTGHPMIALPGYPCPLAGFTLALLAASRKIDRDIYFLTLIWAFVNIPKSFGFMNCYEEITLVLTGFYALGMLKYNEAQQTKNQ